MLYYLITCSIVPLLHKRAAIENVNRAKANGVHPSQTKSGKSQSSHNNEPNGDVKSKEKKTAHAKVFILFFSCFFFSVSVGAEHWIY